MSTVKVSELPVLASADAADEFVVVDDSAGVTKKITFDSLATDVRTESEALTATTVSASGLVTAAGITFGSDTLDDYEEGTWTPTFANFSSTMSFKLGGYIKIGRLVVVHLSFQTPGSFSDSDDVEISGLPFTPVDSAIQDANRVGGFITLNNSGNAGLFFNHETSTNTMLIKDETNTRLSYNTIGTSVRIAGSFIYFTS